MFKIQNMTYHKCFLRELDQLAQMFKIRNLTNHKCLLRELDQLAQMFRIRNLTNHKCLHRELDQLAQMFSQAGSKEEREKVHSLNIQYFFDDIKSDRKLIQIIVLKRRQKLGTDRQTF